MATEQLTASQKDHLVIATGEGNPGDLEVGISVGQPCQLCAPLSLKGLDKKSVSHQQCGVMKSHRFANICMILGKSPNSYGKARLMSPKVHSVKYKSSQSNKIEKCYLHYVIS